jgi:hypothetical protein
VGKNKEDTLLELREIVCPIKIDVLNELIKGIDKYNADCITKDDLIIIRDALKKKIDRD